MLLQISLILAVVWAFLPFYAVTAYQQRRQRCKKGSTNKLIFCTWNTISGKKKTKNKTVQEMLNLLKQHLSLKFCLQKPSGTWFTVAPRGFAKVHNKKSNISHLAGTQLCAAAAAEGPCHPAHLYAPCISPTQPSMSANLNVHHRITCQESEISAVAHFSWVCTCDFS